MSTSINPVTSLSPQSISLSLFTPHMQSRKPRVNKSKAAQKSPRAFEAPELFNSPHSDRVAIFDEVSGSYCAYSLSESVNKMGLTRQEAEEWVQGLLLIKQDVSFGKVFQVGLMIAGSWALTAFAIWSIAKVLM